MVRPPPLSVGVRTMIQKVSMDRLISLVWLAMLGCLSSCASFNAPLDYKLSPSSDYGLAVLSFTANGRVGNFFLQYRDIATSNGGDITLWTFKNPLDWRSPTRGRLVVLELPAGSYEIYQWIAPLSAKSDSSFSIPFRVLRGKATYLGNVHVNIGQGTYEFRVENTAQRDLDVLFRRYPHLRKDDIEIAISSIR